MRALAVGTIALCFAVGCAQTPSAGAEAEAEKPELTPELKALVLDQTPSDIPHSLFLDFSGKAALVGYALEAGTVATPGSKLSLKLYWRSSGKLSPGYVLFTELTTPDGRRFELPSAGPLRSGALVPATWETGKVYVDDLEITVPTDIDAGRFSIVVGLKTEPVAPEEPAAAEGEKADKKAEKADKKLEPKFDSVYLSVLSGTADAKHGGVVATLETGVTTASLRARAIKEKDDKKGVAKRPKLPLAKPAP